MEYRTSCSSVILILFCLCFTWSDVFVRKLGFNVVQWKQSSIRSLLVEFPHPFYQRVERFSGIRYASLRFGALRYFPPASVIRAGRHPEWNNRKSTCIQNVNRFYKKDVLEKYYQKVIHLRHLTHYQTEECLTLDVFTPIRGECCSVLFRVASVVAFLNTQMCILYYFNKSDIRQCRLKQNTRKLIA